MRPLTAGKDRNPGCGGSAARNTVSVREHLNITAPDTIQDTYPHGHPRGWENELPTGRIRRRPLSSPRRTQTENHEALPPECTTCGKTCKNIKGLKIHQTKMGCAPIANLVQRIEQISSQSAERPGPESNHSAKTLNVQDNAVTAPADRPVRERIKWPPMNSTKWEAFDGEVDQTYEVVLCDSINRKLETMPMMIHLMGKEAFGIEPHRVKTPQQQTKSRREIKIENLRREIRTIKRQFKTCQDHEKPGLMALETICGSKLCPSDERKDHERSGE